MGKLLKQTKWTPCVLLLRISSSGFPVYELMYVYEYDSKLAPNFHVSSSRLSGVTAESLVHRQEPGTLCGHADEGFTMSNMKTQMMDKL